MKSAPNCGKILRQARETLGQSVAEVVASLRKNGVPMSRLRYLRIETAALEPNVTEWLALCDALFLDIDSISMGYSEKLHLGRIAWAISAGRCSVTSLALRKAIVRHEGQEKKWQSKFMKSLSRL